MFYWMKILAPTILNWIFGRDRRRWRKFRAAIGDSDQTRTLLAAGRGCHRRIKFGIRPCLAEIYLEVCNILMLNFLLQCGIIMPYTFFYKQPGCLALTRKICPKIKQLAKQLLRVKFKKHYSESWKVACLIRWKCQNRKNFRLRRANCAWYMISFYVNVNLSIL